MIVKAKSKRLIGRTGRKIYARNIPPFYKNLPHLRTIEFGTELEASVGANNLRKDGLVVRRLYNCVAVYGNDDVQF